MSNILTVDDSAMIRRLVGGAVEVLGHTLLEAGDGAEALKVLETAGPDVALIVLDVNMPNMNGFEFLEAIREDGRFTHIPVMMLTTESEKQNIIKAVKLGAANYVNKPFTQEELSTKILESISGGF